MYGDNNIFFSPNFVALNKMFCFLYNQRNCKKINALIGRTSKNMRYNFKKIEKFVYNVNFL